MNKDFVIGEGLRGVVTRAWTKPEQSTTQDVCNVLRNWATPSHEDFVDVMANLAAKVKTANALGAVSSAVVVDMLDEITGQIENDKVEQQAEAMWLDSKRAAA